MLIIPSFGHKYKKGVKHSPAMYKKKKVYLHNKQYWFIVINHDYSWTIRIWLFWLINRGKFTASFITDITQSENSTDTLAV